MFKKIFLIFIGILIPFSIAFALEVDWPPSPMGTVLNASSTLTNLTQYFYEWGIALGGLAAFIALLIAGFLYLTSVGDPQKMADARGRIIWALAGLVLLLAAWLVLNTINPDLTTLQQLEVKPASTTVSVTAIPTTTVATTPCTSIEIKTGAATTIALDECKGFSISKNTTLTATTTPLQCLGFLYFYKETGCKDTDIAETLLLNNNTSYSYLLNFDIKSIKLFSR